jgi:hypothetical protein
MPGFYARGSKPREPARRPWTPPDSRAAVAPLAALTRKPLRIILIVLGLLFLGHLVLNQARRGAPPSAARDIEVARLNLQTLRTAFQRLAEDCGQLPPTRDGIVSLVHNPSLRGWRGPYVLELKPDPWGRPFLYANEGGRLVLSSAGPDGMPRTADDIVLVHDTNAAHPPAEGVYPADIRPPATYTNDGR